MCILHFYVCPKLVCCSCVCHGLEAHLCVLLLIVDLLWCEWISEPSFFTTCILHGPCVILGWSLFTPFLTPSVDLLAFLPCHSVIPTVVLLGLYLLGHFSGLAACFPFYLITVAQYYHWACIHTTSGFLDPFHCLQASLAHFFLYRHPQPISFP